MKSARIRRRARQPAKRPLCASSSGWFGPRLLACELLEDRQMLSAHACSQIVAAAEPWADGVAPVASAALVAEPFAVAVSATEASPLAGTASPGGFSPAQIRHAYGFDQISFSGGTIVGDGLGQTIAIVSAYDAPTIANDLLQFSSTFGLVAPQISADLAAFLAPAGPNDPPRFVRLSQTGTTAYPPTGSSGNWQLESALDVQWAHALAPRANIMLIEATDNTFGNLTAGVDFARTQPGVSVVSMSWGGPEFSTEEFYDSNFTNTTNHAGVVFAAAAGNSGSPGAYPAFSPNVLAVGGTSLYLDGSNNISSETAWSGGGGGISQYEAQPSWQSGFVTQSSTFRGSPDVAFDANPNTGVPVYDSYNNGSVTPWSKVGGTSFATPSWAALVAIADQGRNLAGLPVLDGPELMSALYAMPASNFNDITSGSSGGATPQTAVVGYDLVTGRGSPKVNLIVPALIGTARISGTVFNDLNGNGMLDSESGLAGWTVYADLDNDSAFDPIATTTFTNSTSLSIPNNSTVTSNNVVSGLSGDVADINVKVNITHNNDNDLVLTLISPAGTRITLASHVGGSGNHFTNTIFDDSAAVAISRGTSPFSGSYHPAQPLSAVYGTNPNGTWKLEIQDTSAPTTGTLTSWSLELKTGDPSATSAVDGSYWLDYLPPGTYPIREVPQAPYAQTAPVGGSYTLVVGAGANVIAQNFGNQVPPSATPSGVVLLAGSDTGVSTSDLITNLNNSSFVSALQFQVSGTVAGATVTVYADGIPIGSATAGGTMTIVTTDGTTVLGNGARSIMARQTEPGKPLSPSSPAVSITIDTVAPTASLIAVSPDPRGSAVAQMSIQFDEVASGLELSHFTLSRDAGGNLLSVAQSVTSFDGIAWTLSDLTTLTGAAGFYELHLGSGSPTISDVAGNLYVGSATTSFTVLASVSGRYLFYNQSGTSGTTVRYDGNNAAINALDDNAIAIDKVAYLPGSGPATFANVSSYSKGINGIMIDISGSHPSITAADFIFKVGNNNTPSSWTTAPAPVGVSVRAGAGASGSDRVEIIWANGAIQKQWLEVITLANANSGLGWLGGAYDPAYGDVFYFGNALGDSGLGDTATLFTVNATDELGARNNPESLFNNIPVTNIYDYNRDATVNATDQLIARNNPAGLLTALRAIDLGVPPAAPQGEPTVSPSTIEASGSTASPATVGAGTDDPPPRALGSPSWSVLALSTAAAQRQLHAHVDPSREWLDDVDERLLRILAIGRHAAARRRT